jgi:hypothetical protein
MIARGRSWEGRAAWLSALVLLAIPCAAEADEHYQFTAITLAATDLAKQDSINGVGTEDKRKAVLQAEHFGENNWGFFYGDVEYTHGKGVGAVPQLGNQGAAQSLYAVAIPSVSLAKITGTSFTRGPLTDVGLLAILRASSYYQYRSYGIGLSFNFSVPGFLWFESGVTTHNSQWSVQPNTFDTNTGRDYTLDSLKWMWRTYLISKPIVLGEQRFHYIWFSFINGSGSHQAAGHGAEFFVRQDFLWEVLKHSDFQLGIRYEYVRHKNDPAINFGDNTFVANVPFLMFKYTL